MWWRNTHKGWLPVRLSLALAIASLAGGCWEPLYGNHPTAQSGSVQSETVRDKLAAIEIPVIPAPKGQPSGRLAVILRNALQYGFNNSAGANAPTHRLIVNVTTTQMTVIVDPNSGRPNAEVDSVIASYRLVEIATGRTVVADTTFSHVDFDVPGSQQRFARQRAQRDAEDHATEAVAETIRNRLASYFVAGT
jgi:LPS-assembly lipoprotein